MVQDPRACIQPAQVDLGQVPHALHLNVSSRAGGREPAAAAAHGPGFGLSREDSVKLWS